MNKAVIALLVLAVTAFTADASKFPVKLVGFVRLHFALAVSVAAQLALCESLL